MSWLPGKGNGRATAWGTHARARTDQLVTEECGDELLVYDQSNDQAHCLSRDAALVWRACDSTKTAEEIAAALGSDAATVNRALHELDGCGLLDTGPAMTRREATIRAARVSTAAAAAGPLIYSIIAPTPALASSQNFCTAQGCQSGCGHCKQLGCACCGPGGGDVKLCTADCSEVNCNRSIVNAFHCGTPVTSVSCNTF